MSNWSDFKKYWVSFLLIAVLAIILFVTDQIFKSRVARIDHQIEKVRSNEN